MNYGPLIFLAAFLAMAGSWFGFVITPQAQVGRQQPTNTLGAPVSYPVSRSGMARQGLQIYRANGCADCHSQQLRQTGATLAVTLAEASTNKVLFNFALRDYKPGLSEAGMAELASGLPKVILTGLTRAQADAAVRALNGAGAKASLKITPYGPDLARGWGLRRSVAEDFLYDDAVLLGALRAGPDLADLGARLPDLNWQLCHLYWPRSEVKESYMPAYPFLFEKRPKSLPHSPDALVFPMGADPAPGYEIVPSPAAKSLAAYLVSLRAEAPLFDAPLTPPPSAAANTATNVPAASGDTNAAPVNPPKSS